MGTVVRSNRLRHRQRKKGSVSVPLDGKRQVGSPARLSTNFVELPSNWLLILGAFSFLLFSFIGYIVYKVTPLAVEIGNHMPFNQWGLEGFALAALLLAMAVVMWLAWTVAARCQALIVERHFK